MATHLDRERVHPETLLEWRDWLVDNHERTDGVWLVSWRSVLRRPAFSYEQAVIEALTVGWVDSVKRKLDEERSILWFSRRRQDSGWSQSNKERIALLEQEGRMLPAGARAVEIAKANGAWTLLDDVENLVVPDDLAVEFASVPGAWEQWDGFPPSARRAILDWIVHAKTPATRAKRITETVAKAAVGQRANQWPRS